MYFKSLKMVNFRKFRTIENIIEFADAESYEKQKCDNEVDVNVASTVVYILCQQQHIDKVHHLLQGIMGFS